MKGLSGWPACDGDQVISRHRQTRDHWIAANVASATSTVQWIHVSYGVHVGMVAYCGH